MKEQNKLVLFFFFLTNIIKRDRLEKTYRWVTLGPATVWNQNTKRIPLIAAADGASREEGQQLEVLKACGPLGRL